MIGTVDRDQSQKAETDHNQCPDERPGRANWSRRGSAVYSPGWSVSSTRTSASIRLVTSAPSAADPPGAASLCAVRRGVPPGGAPGPGGSVGKLASAELSQATLDAVAPEAPRGPARRPRRRLRVRARRRAPHRLQRRLSTSAREHSLRPAMPPPPERCCAQLPPDLLRIPAPRPRCCCCLTSPSTSDRRRPSSPAWC